MQAQFAKTKRIIAILWTFMLALLVWVVVQESLERGVMAIAHGHDIVFIANAIHLDMRPYARPSACRAFNIATNGVRIARILFIKVDPSLGLGIWDIIACPSKVFDRLFFKRFINQRITHTHLSKNKNHRQHFNERERERVKRVWVN